MKFIVSLWFGLFFSLHIYLVGTCVFIIYLTGGYLVIIAEGQIPIEVGRILPPSCWVIPLDISNAQCGRAQPFLTTEPYWWEFYSYNGQNQMSQRRSRALHLLGSLWNPPDSISKPWQMLGTWPYTQQYTMPVSKIWWHWHFEPKFLIHPIHLCCRWPRQSILSHYCPYKLWLKLGILLVPSFYNVIFDSLS